MRARKRSSLESASSRIAMRKPASTSSRLMARAKLAVERSAGARVRVIEEVLLELVEQNEDGPAECLRARAQQIIERQ